MTQWTYYVCEVTTGRLVGELPLVNVSAQRHMKLGSFSADLPLEFPPPPDGQLMTEHERFQFWRPVLRERLAITAEGKYSIVVDRDGVPLGEWIIWKRDRSNPTKLQGTEFGSLLERQPMPAQVFKRADQFAIAQFMVRAGFGTPRVLGSTAITIPAAASPILRDRTYDPGDSTSILQRLDELSDVDDGFDWVIDSTWSSVGGARYITRTLRLAYPRLGIDQPITLDRPGPGGSGGSILDFELAADATDLASRVVVYGAGEGSAKVTGVATNPTLINQGYPAMTATASYSSVSVQATINGHARALLAVAQSSEQPPTVTIRGDVEPVIGTYGLGDRVMVAVEPCPELPDGYFNKVRILGWTFTPGPGPEVVPLEVAQMSDEPGSDVAPS